MTSVALVRIGRLTFKAQTARFCRASHEWVRVAKALIASVSVEANLKYAATIGWVFLAFVHINASLCTSIRNVVNFGSHLRVAIALVATAADAIVAPFARGVRHAKR